MSSIQIEWVYAPEKNHKSTRILVDKTSPFGRKLHDLKVDYWCPQVSPSLNLLRRLQKGEISEKDFNILYRREIQNNPDKLSELLEAAQKGGLVLVTAQRDPEPKWIEILKILLEHRLVELEASN